MAARRPESQLVLWEHTPITDQDLRVQERAQAPTDKVETPTRQRFLKEQREHRQRRLKVERSLREHGFDVEKLAHRLKALLEDGVRRLDQDAQGRHKVSYVQVPWETDRIVLLQGIEHTDFFKKVRSDLVVSLYNQEELWPKFGYEGSSAEHGGYTNRGFNDIDWLPKV